MACVRFQGLMPSAHREHRIAGKILTNRLEKLVQMRRKRQAPRCRKMMIFVWLLHSWDWLVCFLICFPLPPGKCLLKRDVSLWAKLREHGNKNRRWIRRRKKKKPTKINKCFTYYLETSLGKPQRNSVSEGGKKPAGTATSSYKVSLT